MRKRIDVLKADLIDLQKRSVQYNFLKREADSTRELYNGLLQKFKEVDVAGGMVRITFSSSIKPKFLEVIIPRLVRAIALAFLLALGPALVRLSCLGEA